MRTDFQDPTRSVRYMCISVEELSPRRGRRRLNARAAAAQRRLVLVGSFLPNPGLIFVFDPQHGPETV